MRYEWLTRVFLFTILLVTTNAYAAPESFEIYDSKTKSIITCKKVNNIWEPGSVAKKNKKFTSFSDQINQISKRLATMVNKRPGLEEQLKNLKKYIKSQQRLCKNASSSVPDPKTTPRDGQATPKATATKASGATTPKPTATASGCTPCYTSGSTRCFNIPSGITGNSSQGASRWASSGSCASCHPNGSKNNRTYSQILASFTSWPQMAPLKVNYSTQDLANIAAYLNSNNSKQCTSQWP